MDAFLRDFLSTTRVVFVGRTESMVKRLLDTPLATLLAYEGLIALLIGIQTFEPRKMIGYPLFLTGITIFWVLLFAMIGDLKREQMPGLYALFLGTSTFLLPGIIPLIGPLLLQGLLLGWPFVLARALAHHLEWTPGKAFTNLVLPPLILWLTLQGVLFIVGRAFFRSTLTS